MLFYVLNESYNKIGVIDNHVSAIWATRYFEPGDFEIYLGATEKYKQLFKKGYYIQRPGDRTLMIIEDIKISTDVENGNYVTISGRDLKSVLDRRVIWKQKTYSGTIETRIRKMIDSNFINAEESRVIPEMKLGTSKGFKQTMNSTQYTGNNVLEVVVELCKASGLGFDILFDNGKFVFEMYAGTDRSFKQNENLRVLFSSELGNIINSEFIENTKNLKNTCLIGGEGEGTARTYASVGTATGLNRREMFVDARDLSSTTENEDGEQIELTANQYSAILKERGTEALTENSVVTNFTGEIETTVLYKLNEDFYLGDIVGVVGSNGNKYTSRIIEVIESEDATGRIVIPTFESFENEV